MSRLSNADLIEEFKKNPTLENYRAIAGTDNIGIDVGKPTLQEGLTTIKRGDKTFVTTDDMPTGFLPRTVAGIYDLFVPGDQDKRGAFQNPFKDVSEETIGLKEVKSSDLKYSPVQSRRLANTLEEIFEEPKTALEQTEEYKDSLKSLLGDKELRKLRRQARTEEAIQNQLQYIATEPIRQAFANKAAEAAAQRGLRIRAAKEAMPSNIQNIMLSKQAQQATAASAEAERARAAADQQDAATRFAGLGMQRRFG